MVADALGNGHEEWAGGGQYLHGDSHESAILQGTLDGEGLPTVGDDLLIEPFHVGL